MQLSLKWTRQDSNLRNETYLIYSQAPLTTRPLIHILFCKVVIALYLLSPSTLQPYYNLYFLFCQEVFKNFFYVFYTYKMICLINLCKCRSMLITWLLCLFFNYSCILSAFYAKSYIHHDPLFLTTCPVYFLNA